MGRGVPDMSVSVTTLAFSKQRSPECRVYLFRDRCAKTHTEGAAREGTRRTGAQAREVSAEVKTWIMKLFCPNPHMQPNVLRCLKEVVFLAASTMKRSRGGSLAYMQVVRTSV